MEPTNNKSNPSTTSIPDDSLDEKIRRGLNALGEDDAQTAPQKDDFGDDDTNGYGASPQEVGWGEDDARNTGDYCATDTQQDVAIECGKVCPPKRV